jgi:hypothetical protein
VDLIVLGPGMTAERRWIKLRPDLYTPLRQTRELTLYAVRRDALAQMQGDLPPATP